MKRIIIRVPALTVILDEWHDLSAAMAQARDSLRGAGHGGVGYLYLIDSLPAMTHGKPVVHTGSRLRASGRDTVCRCRPHNRSSTGSTSVHHTASA